jgi:arsenate reductase-like glutaredoxin family protein
MTTTTKKKVILYADRDGRFCQAARVWLKGRGIDFEERLAETPETQEEVFEVSEQYALPVIVCGKDVIVGYDERRLAELLG